MSTTADIATATSRRSGFAAPSGKLAEHEHLPVAARQAIEGLLDERDDLLVRHLLLRRALGVVGAIMSPVRARSTSVSSP
jgi:hypothetical protein